MFRGLRALGGYLRGRLRGDKAHRGRAALRGAPGASAAATPEQRSGAERPAQPRAAGEPSAHAQPGGVTAQRSRWRAGAQRARASNMAEVVPLVLRRARRGGC